MTIIFEKGNRFRGLDEAKTKKRDRGETKPDRILPLGACGGSRASLMKLITTFPLERYDIPTFGLQAPPRASEARQNYYNGLQIAP